MEEGSSSDTIMKSGNFTLDKKNKKKIMLQNSLEALKKIIKFEYNLAKDDFVCVILDKKKMLNEETYRQFYSSCPLQVTGEIKIIPKDVCQFFDWMFEAKMLKDQIFISSNFEKSNSSTTCKGNQNSSRNCNKFDNTSTIVELKIEVDVGDSIVKMKGKSEKYITIRNTGNQKWPDTLMVTVNRNESKQILIDNLDIPSLNPGEEKDVRLTLKPKKDIGSGRYTVHCKIIEKQKNSAICNDFSFIVDFEESEEQKVERIYKLLEEKYDKKVIRKKLKENNGNFKKTLSELGEMTVKV